MISSGITVDIVGHVQWGIWQSLVYRYEYSPAYERLDYDSLRGFQCKILDLLRQVWAARRRTAALCR